MCTKPVSPKVQQTIIPSAKTGGSRKHTVNTQGQGGRWAAANQHASSAFHYPTCVPHTRKTRTPRPSRAPSPPCLLPFPFYTPRHHSLLHTTTAPAPAPKREEEDASCPTAAPLPPPSLSLSPSAELDATMISARAATVAAASPASPVRSTSVPVRPARPRFVAGVLSLVHPAEVDYCHLTIWACVCVCLFSAVEAGRRTERGCRQLRRMQHLQEDRAEEGRRRQGARLAAEAGGGGRDRLRRGDGDGGGGGGGGGGQRGAARHALGHLCRKVSRRIAWGLCLSSTSNISMHTASNNSTVALLASSQISNCLFYITSVFVCLTSCILLYVLSWCLHRRQLYHLVCLSF